MLEYIEVLCHSSIKINKEKVIYIDPFKIDKNYNDADMIFVTHDHYDHYSEEDIEIKVDKLVLDILENEELTKEEADLLKDFMKDQVSKIKNMPEFVTRIENACK